MYIFTASLVIISCPEAIRTYSVQIVLIFVPSVAVFCVTPSSSWLHYGMADISLPAS